LFVVLFDLALGEDAADAAAIAFCTTVASFRIKLKLYNLTSIALGYWLY